MNHIGTKELETDRLILRRISVNDAEQMYNNWANNFEVSKYTTWQAHKNIDETKELLKIWENEYENNDCYRWCIVLKDKNKPIGTIDACKKDDILEFAEIGYCISQEYWRKGITTEAGKAVIKFLFNKVGYNRIQARYMPQNIGSGKVMLKLGMQYEGIQREAYKDNNGNFCDVAICAILKKDFKEE